MVGRTGAQVAVEALVGVDSGFGGGSTTSAGGGKDMPATMGSVDAAGSGTKQVRVLHETVQLSSHGSEQHYTIAIGTFNVAGSEHIAALDGRESLLSDWLLRAGRADGADGADEASPDIIAVGLQEMVPLDASNIVSPGELERLAWSKVIARALGEDYAALTCEQMVGVCLFTYARRSLFSSISGVSTETCLRGAG